MWYCTSCGTGNEDSARFCVECGLSRFASVSSSADNKDGQTTVLNQSSDRNPASGAYPGWPAQSTPSPGTYGTPSPGTYGTTPSGSYGTPSSGSYGTPPSGTYGTSAPGKYAPPSSGAYAQPSPGGYAAPKKRKSLWWLWVLLGLVTLALVAVVCFFTIHKWEPATCTEPETCSICGRTRGAPLGHTGDPATCTEDFVCTRCGYTEPALGHDWQEATYDEPETCSRCGLTRGELKGWVGDLSGYMGTESLYLNGKGESHPYILDRVIHKCLHLTLFIQLNEIEGEPYGDWGLYARDLNGNWSQIATFTVTENAYHNFVSFDIVPIGMPTFDALSMVPVTDGDYTISYTFYYEDVQEYID